VAAKLVIESSKNKIENKILQHSLEAGKNVLFKHPKLVCTGKQFSPAVCLHCFFIRTKGFFLGWIIKNPM
jgi:hypothetical protein